MDGGFLGDPQSDSDVHHDGGFPDELRSGIDGRSVDESESGSDNEYPDEREIGMDHEFLDEPESRESNDSTQFMALS